MVYLPVVCRCRLSGEWARARIDHFYRSAVHRGNRLMGLQHDHPIDGHCISIDLLRCRRAAWDHGRIQPDHR